MRGSLQFPLLTIGLMAEARSLDSGENQRPEACGGTGTNEGAREGNVIEEKPQVCS